MKVSLVNNEKKEQFVSFYLLLQTFEREANKESDNEFVECLVFSQDRAVVMTGNMVDSCTPGNCKNPHYNIYFGILITEYCVVTRS